MANISNLVSAEWFFGLSFNQTAAENMTGNVPIAAQWAQQILGSNLRGLAIGNEPDLCVFKAMGRLHSERGLPIAMWITKKENPDGPSRTTFPNTLP